MEQQLGTVHFRVSCAAGVQKPFERGVALLHSFWYEEAEKKFAQIAKDDPRCAMAQWGLAMSQWHQLWNHPDDATIKKGLARDQEDQVDLQSATRGSGNTSQRSRLSTVGGGLRDRATAYSKAMEKVYPGQPRRSRGGSVLRALVARRRPGNDPNFTNDKKPLRYWRSCSPSSPTIRE